MKFPENFTWGVSTASYQNEGAAFEDGKGLAGWDVLCRKPGIMWNNETGDVACDFYHRYREDIKLLKFIGVNAFRMSVSWPRVLPEGTGRANPKGLDFYDRVVDELLKAKIDPYITLFHWNPPYALLCRGGWLNPDMPDWFADYTRVVMEKLSDRVTHWLTLNEPQCFIDGGYRTGWNSPGLTMSFPEVLKAAHITLLSHGKAVKAIRAYSKRKASVGICPYSIVKMPETNSPKDIATARKATFLVTEKDVHSPAWWMDPIYLGRYPESGLKLFGKDVPKYTQDDMDLIQQPLDYFAVNMYGGIIVRAGKNGEPEKVPFLPGYEITTREDFAVTPDALYWGPKFMHERYKLPVVITENGYPNLDCVFPDNRVHDPQRVHFLYRYLNKLAKTIKEGVDVRGYFIWTFTDNFEWTGATSKRYGIVYIDFNTQKRTLKDSAYWYKKVIRTSGDSLRKAPEFTFRY